MGQDGSDKRKGDKRDGDRRETCNRERYMMDSDIDVTGDLLTGGKEMDNMVCQVARLLDRTRQAETDTKEQL